MAGTSIGLPPLPDTPRAQAPGAGPMMGGASPFGGVDVVMAGLQQAEAGLNQLAQGIPNLAPAIAQLISQLRQMIPSAVIASQNSGGAVQGPPGMSMGMGAGPGQMA